MASLWKHHNSSYWSACYTDREGRQMKRTTKQTDKRKALLIAVEWERVEAQARRSGVSTRQMQKVLNDMLEKTNEETIVTPSTEKYLRDWLTGIETKNSKGTYERYKHTVDLFLDHIKGVAKSPVTSPNSRKRFRTGQCSSPIGETFCQPNITGTGQLKSGFNRHQSGPTTHPHHSQQEQRGWGDGGCNLSRHTAKPQFLRSPLHANLSLLAFRLFFQPGIFAIVTRISAPINSTIFSANLVLS